MGKLDNLLATLPKEAPAESALLPLINSLVTLIQKQSDAQSADTKTNASIKAEVERLTKITKELTEASRDVSGAAAKGVASQVSELLEGLEQALRAEFKAIKYPDMPKQKAVDLKPIVKAVTDAIGNIPPPPAHIESEAPEPRKLSWEFEFIRNKRTGLLEKVIAT